MTVVYTVSEHPALDKAVKDLVSNNEELFLDRVALAASLLGVDETVYTGDDLVKIERAIALQLNYMALIKPAMFIYQSESSSHSKQAVSYRNNLSLIYPFAVMLVKNVTYEGGWDNIKAVR